MRQPKDILADLCKEFGITVELYKEFQNGKRTPDYINLITMGYVFILSSTSTLNLTDIGKTIGKKANTISVCKTRVQRIFSLENNFYTKAFKEKLKNSCEEGRQAIASLK